MKITWITLALLSGAFLPIQGGLNSRLGKEIESPVHASLLSFIVGAITIALYCLATRQHVLWTGLKAAPAYLWLGGILGAFYVTAIIFAFSRLGPALTFGLVVAGQMIMSVLLDHFNVLVVQPQAVNIGKIIGIALIISGVTLIRKF
jgi:transporter family-2 protein